MDTILHGISALQYHRTPPLIRSLELPPPPGGNTGAPTPELAPRANSPHDAKVLQANLFGALKGVALPFHLVSRGRSRSRSPHIIWHDLELEYPATDLQRVSDDLLVTTPERTLFDLASRLTLMGLARLMFEACGIHAIVPQTSRLESACEELLERGVLRPRMPRSIFAFLDCDGRQLYALEEQRAATRIPPPWEPCFDTQETLTDLWKRPPLVSVGMLNGFARAVEAAGPHRGTSRFRRAVDLVIPGSASPAETLFALLAFMPRKLGGEALPRPHLNRQIRLDEDAARALGHPLCVGDVLWDDGLGGLLPVCVEIDGAAFHDSGGTSRGATFARRDDSARANAMRSSGFEVISATHSQMVNINRWELLMNTVAGALDMNRRAQTPAFSRQRARLRNELFGPPVSYGVGV